MRSILSILFLTQIFFSCRKQAQQSSVKNPEESGDSDSGSTPSGVEAIDPELRLLFEYKFNTIYPTQNEFEDYWESTGVDSSAPDITWEHLTKWETSGVAIRDGMAYFAYDNSPLLARIRLTDLESGNLFDLTDKAFRPITLGEGFEALAFIPGTDRMLAVIEAVTLGENDPIAAVLPGDHNIHSKLYLLTIPDSFSGDPMEEEKWFEREFRSANKGYEGIAVRSYNDETLIYALCEGNACLAGDNSAETNRGGVIDIYALQSGDSGEILSFYRDASGEPVRILLQEDLAFTDYSGLDIFGDKIAVISQEDSKVLIATIEGINSISSAVVYDLPRKVESDDRKIWYCNTEGISFVSESILLMVSDRRKDDQKKRCNDKDESLHVFGIPE